MNHSNSIDSCILCNSYPCLCSKNPNVPLAALENASETVFRAHAPSRMPQPARPTPLPPTTTISRIYHDFVFELASGPPEKMTQSQRRDFLIAALVSRALGL